MFENLRRVAMREEIIGFEIFVDFDELEVAAWISACAADAGFAIADDALVWRDKTSIGERAEGKDDAGGVAAGIGDEASFCDFFGIELGKAVDGFAEIISVRRRQLVPGGECFRCVKAEGAAQIHDTQTRFEKRGGEFGGNFMRRGEKSGSRCGRCDGVERKETKRGLSPAAELRKEFGNAVGAARFAHVERAGSNSGMAQEQAGQLEAGVSGDTYDGDLARVSHFSRDSIFFWRDSRVRLLGVIMRTVSSPAMVPAISVNFEPSTAAARGWAPLGGVFRTSKFSAGRISRRNSRRARASGGRGSAPLSSGSTVSGL